MMDDRRHHGGAGVVAQQQQQRATPGAADAWLSSTGEFFLANYELGRKIGNGSFGVVRLALHKLTGHHVAVKIISKKKLQEKDPQSESKLRREIKILSILQHPHILRMYEVVETRDHIYIVTEYVEGGELFDHITRVGRLPETEARHLFQQMIAGIEYCHRHMVVHRDLKPENLEGYFLKTSCGSFNYAAPEVIKGARYAGPEVDVWSSGVVLFALLCGVLPFNDDMQQGIPYVLRKILAGNYSIPHFVSPQAQDLISRMLRVDPLQRITVTEIKQHPWFRCNLPRYVAMVDDDGEPADRSAAEVNETALSQAQTLGFSREVVLESLQHGLRNKAAVTYWLLADALTRQRQAGSFSRTTISPASVVNLVRAQGLLPPGSEDPSSILQQRLVVERVYRLGVRTTMHPSAIMHEVIRVLLRCGVAWKKAGRYCLRCRCLVLQPDVPADSASQCAPEAWPQPSAAMWHAAGATANMHANHVASEPNMAAPHDNAAAAGGSAMALDEVASWAGQHDGHESTHVDGCNGCGGGGARGGKGKGGGWGQRGSGDVCMRDTESAPGRASATAVMHALKVWWCIQRAYANNIAPVAPQHNCQVSAPASAATPPSKDASTPPRPPQSTLKPMEAPKTRRSFEVIPGLRLPSGVLAVDPPGATVLKLELQLFKAREEVYLLDFQRLQGPLYHVLDLCARLTHELRL